MRTSGSIVRMPNQRSDDQASCVATERSRTRRKAGSLVRQMMATARSRSTRTVMILMSMLAGDYRILKSSSSYCRALSHRRSTAVPAKNFARSKRKTNKPQQLMVSARMNHQMSAETSERMLADRQIFKHALSEKFFVDPAARGLSPTMTTSAYAQPINDSHAAIECRGCQNCETQRHEIQTRRAE